MDLKKLGLTYLDDTLEQLKETSKEEVQRQLDMIKEYTKDDKFPIYPFYELVPDQDGKKVRQMKKPSSKDGILVANTIIARLFSYLQREVTRLMEEASDVDEFCNWLDYLEKEASQEEKDEALKTFDDTFSYLEKVPIYSNIYFSFRKDYIKLLARHIRQVQSKIMLHKEASKTSYLKQVPRSKPGRALQKHIENKPQRKKNRRLENEIQRY